jgi:hypothetical protein
MKCKICKKGIVLVPSAAERARKFGGKPSDYTKLFTIHDKCLIEHRGRETVELMKRLQHGTN